MFSSLQPPLLTDGGCVFERQLGLGRLPDEVAEGVSHQLAPQTPQHLPPGQLVTEAREELQRRSVCTRQEGTSECQTRDMFTTRPGPAL